MFLVVSLPILFRKTPELLVWILPEAYFILFFVILRKKIKTQFNSCSNMIKLT